METGVRQRSNLSPICQSTHAAQSALSQPAVIECAVSHSKHHSSSSYIICHSSRNKSDVVGLCIASRTSILRRKPRNFSGIHRPKNSQQCRLFTTIIEGSKTARPFTESVICYPGNMPCDAVRKERIRNIAYFLSMAL